MLIRTLLRHYKRHPVQALFLLIGIIVSNVLLVGTLLINAQARASYEQGEQYLSGTPLGQIRHRDNNRMIDESDYTNLRRLGFDMLVPFLRQHVRTENDQTLELSGVDIFALPRNGRLLNTGIQQNTGDQNIIGFAFPPYQTWLAPARMEQLGMNEGDRIRLPSGGQLPPLVPVSGQQLGHRLLLGLEALQTISSNENKLSSILVFPTSGQRLAQLRDQLPGQLVFVGADESPSPRELTRSFHLNLAAMGLLAFVVGVFLTYNAVAFSYTDRSDLIRKLRLAGVFKSELRRALLLELTLFLVLGVLIGAWLGAQLSAWLLPGVGQTLAQLYGVYIAYPDGLVPTGLWLPVMMTLIAGGLCVLYPLREALETPLLERRQGKWQVESIIRRDQLLALCGLGLLAVARVTGMMARHLWEAMAGMA